LAKTDVGARANENALGAQILPSDKLINTKSIKIPVVTGKHSCIPGRSLLPWVHLWPTSFTISLPLRRFLHSFHFIPACFDYPLNTLRYVLLPGWTDLSWGCLGMWPTSCGAEGSTALPVKSKRTTVERTCTRRSMTIPPIYLTAEASTWHLSSCWWFCGASRVGVTWSMPPAAPDLES
jgi:hypothetical protein